MCDTFERVGLAVRPIVDRVNAPFVAGAVVFHVQDAIHHRVAQVYIGRGHVDLGAQDLGAVRKLAGFHAREEVEVFFDRTLAVGAVFAGIFEGATVFADLVGGLVVDIGQAFFDQRDSPFVELGEVIGGVVFVLAPLETQPADVLFDRVDVLLFLFGGVGIIETQVILAAEFFGDAEVDADGFGVADGQIGVGLGREAGDDVFIATFGEVFVDFFAQEVAGFFCFVLVFVFVAHCFLIWRG